MTTTRSTMAPPAVTLAPAGLRHELRAISMVWRREMIRFGRDRARMFAMLLQPLLFLFVMGTGLSSVVDTGGSFDFRTFLYPGVLAMSVLFTAAFSGISLVWDREFGFLREMLVAPVSTSAILVGKCLGGATAATLQSVVLLLLAGVVGVPYSLPLFAMFMLCLFLGALMLTSMGVLMSVRVKQIQAAMPMSQLIIMPMMFLSGALFPLANLPGWLAVATKLNPLTYAVQPMRSAVFDELGVTAAVRDRLDPAITWFGWDVPILVQLGVVVVVTLALLVAATALFDRTD
jgi:ABC-2 type transport system permease protein